MSRRDPWGTAFVDGARLFDSGAFFAAHEAWEGHWRVETSPDARRELQGLIQIAAGFHKVTVMRDPASASRLLARGLAKLRARADLAAFRAGVEACADALARARGDFDASMIPRLGG